jgi:hypothetical protein
LHDAPILRQHANPEPDGIFGKDNVTLVGALPTDFGRAAAGQMQLTATLSRATPCCNLDLRFID